MKAKPKTGGKNQVDCAKQDEPRFRYSLELVASIAAHFVDGNTSDAAAIDHALKLLDEVSKTIERKTILLHARHHAERLSKELPRHLPFAKGIRHITGRKTETEATNPFRDYLRLNLRLSDLGRPSRLTDEQVKALLRPFAEGKEKEAEDAQIEKGMASFRSTGFSQVDLVTIKRDRDFLQTAIVRPYQNSEKGKMPPAPGKKRGRRSSSEEK